MSIMNIGISPIWSYCQSHTHSAWEIILNLQGAGSMTVHAEEYRYKPGTIICLPPNVPHVKYCDSQFRDIYLQAHSFLLSDLPDKNAVQIFQDDSEKSFETLILLANRVYNGKEKNYQEITNSLYTTMENILLGWSQSSPYEDAEIEKLKNALTNSFTNPELSIDELLGQGTYCVDHLRRLFKKSTGLSPLGYLTRLRLNYAKNLLSQNHRFHYTIGDIGMMSGFYDISYFSRIFKKYTGKSPIEYCSAPTR